MAEEPLREKDAYSEHRRKLHYALLPQQRDALVVKFKEIWYSNPDEEFNAFVQCLRDTYYKKPKEVRDGYEKEVSIKNKELWNNKSIETKSTAINFLNDANAWNLNRAPEEDGFKKKREAMIDAKPPETKAASFAKFWVTYNRKAPEEHSRDISNWKSSYSPRSEETNKPL